MSCECAQCRQHYRTLGIAFGIPEESAIEEAYREAVKQWHPDLYENYASLRADAEERFKQIQVAYRELKEHSGVAVETPVESIVVKPDQPPEPPPVATTISFGDAPGCLAAQQFTEEVEEIIARHLGKADRALAIVDLSGKRSHPARYSHFLLLATRGMMVRDARGLVSLLWYKDLGEVSLTDKHKGGGLGFSRRFMGGFAGSQHHRSLQICRSNGSVYLSLTDQVDDNVKEVIYDFLLRQKTQAVS
ncbi:MAG: J domain-containing protein [Terracidiphilus sp.]|jgi:hypothetical protein